MDSTSETQTGAGMSIADWREAWQTLAAAVAADAERVPARGMNWKAHTHPATSYVFRYEAQMPWYELDVLLTTAGGFFWLVKKQLDDVHLRPERIASGEEATADAAKLAARAALIADLLDDTPTAPMGVYQDPPLVEAEL